MTYFHLVFFILEHYLTIGRAPVNFLGYPTMHPFTYCSLNEHIPVKFTEKEGEKDYKEKKYTPFYGFARPNPVRLQIYGYRKSTKKVIHNNNFFYCLTSIFRMFKRITETKFKIWFTLTKKKVC